MMSNPDLKEWMLKVENRLGHLEAYMKVIGGILGVCLPVILYIGLQILLRL